MCAIAGVLGPVITPETRQRLLQTMYRRGPDGNGCYHSDDLTLLHTRLAVIDPAGGAQPMTLQLPGQTMVICYNGELYNTEEVRRELEKLGHSFQTRSDTEVVLHAYAQWKQEALHRLNGIFAFAVWEKERRTLFLARDRIGVKPLFFIHRPGLFAFASEIKTLLAVPGVQPRLDAEGAAQILLLGPGRAPGSGVFRDIYELEPGQYGVLEKGIFSVRRYWQLTDQPHTDSLPDTARKVRELVTDSIRRQMVSDVPLGTFLSGGLDSSIITAVCAAEAEKKGELLQTFSLDHADQARYFHPGKFQPEADTDYIRLMCDTVPGIHHWTVQTPQRLVDALEDATIARDLPGMADVDFSLLDFCRDIRSYVTVALSGECADEIFGGYPWYRDPAVRDVDGFPWAQTTAQRSMLMHPAIREKIDPFEFVHSHYQDTIDRTDLLPGQSRQEKRMKQMVNLNFRWFMQTLLDRKDRMSMFSALEVRVPFCDYRIAQYLYSVPWEYKDYRGQEKGLLRLAMDGLLPPQVLYRKKSPYPKTHDPAYLSLVSRRLRQVLDTADSPIFALVPPPQLRMLLDMDFSWPWYGQLMGRAQTIAYMLQINFWMKHYKITIV